MPGSDLNETALHPEPAGHHLSALLTRAGFRHAFFTRRGGASEGPFESLSFSTAVGDRAEHVEENLRRAGAVLGVAPERIVYLSQVHGREAFFFDEPVQRAETLASMSDSFNKTMASFKRLSPELNKQAIQLDVLQRLVSFAQAKFPQHLTAMVELLEPFGEELAKVK